MPRVPRILTGPLRRALVIENPDPSLDAYLIKAGFEVERLHRAPDEDALIQKLNEGNYEILFKRSRVDITRRVVESAETLAAIQLCCIGDDSVDKAACAEHGILVFNDPVSNGRSVVELVVGHLVAMSRRLYETVQSCEQGIWDKSTTDRYEIQGKVLGVLGLGKIGRQVARACEALGMDILFYDTRPVSQEVGQEMGWAMAESLEKLFRGSDAVTVHVSATDMHGNSNAGLITQELLQSIALDRQNRDVSPRLFINLARGVVHSAEDLLAAIQSGAVKHAAVDVFPEEPSNNGPGWRNPYTGEKRVVSTPHIGAATQEAQPRIARRVATTAEGYARYGMIRDCVFSPRTAISMQDEADGDTVLFVIHATTRGTKKALDDAIYEAEANNLRSNHTDFEEWGIALDVNLLDRELSRSQLDRIIARTYEITGDPHSVRLVRQVRLR